VLVVVAGQFGERFAAIPGAKRPNPPSSRRSCTAACVPACLDGSAIVRHMHARYRTVIAGQRTRLSGRVIRFGTMGWVDAGDILTDLHYLGCTLRDLGHAPPAGAGVAAAARMLAQ
jgi:aspartate aminotransferase-like enzyme